MNLIILTEQDRREETFILSDYRAEHIIQILKGSVGDSLQVGLLNGPVGSALISSIEGEEVILSEAQLTAVELPEPIIDLIVALPRPQTLKKILNASATMAVRRIHLIRANRVEKSYFSSPLLKPENQLPFLLEGLAQGGQTRLPEVIIHDRFKRFFEDSLPESEAGESLKPLKLFGHHEATKKLPEVYQDRSERALLAIGPEGGWVPFEIDLMTASGFESFSLGRWVLRVEQALVASLAQIELLSQGADISGQQSRKAMREVSGE